jgi:Group II intron, maturase-specific domain
VDPRNRNGLLHGWFEYFKHSKSNVFESIDGYTRGRLRSILRKRHGGKGRGRAAIISVGPTSSSTPKA